MNQCLQGSFVSQINGFPPSPLENPFVVSNTTVYRLKCPLQSFAFFADWMLEAQHAAVTFAVRACTHPRLAQARHFSLLTGVPTLSM